MGYLGGEDDVGIVGGEKMGGGGAGRVPTLGCAEVGGGAGRVPTLGCAEIGGGGGRVPTFGCAEGDV